MSDLHLYTKRWRLDRAKGLTRLVDARASRRHLEALEQCGWTTTAVAKATGVPASTLHRIRKGQPRIKRIWATKVLKFIGDALPAHTTRTGRGALIRNTGAVRRVQALLALGWSHGEIRRLSGVNTSAVIRSEASWVSRSTHDRLAATYVELSRRPGPSTRTRAYAKRKGYLSPAFWDDIDLDPAPIRDESEVA